MSTGFAVLASTKPRVEAVDSLVSELGQQAGRVAGVGGEDPEAAGVRQDGDPAAGRLWVGREEGRDVNQLFERARANDACLVEERVDGAPPSLRALRYASSRRAGQVRSSRS